jgi:dUTP pyrophosphatase
MINVKVKKLDPEAKLPTQAYEGDAGWDLYALKDYNVDGNNVTEVQTGVAFEIPYGYQMQVHTRSSFGKRGLKCHLGIVDAGYRGEITIWITASHPATFHEIKKGDKIAQVVFAPVIPVQLVEVEELNNSERGERGHGSSGR